MSEYGWLTDRGLRPNADVSIKSPFLKLLQDRSRRRILTRVPNLEDRELAHRGRFGFLVDRARVTPLPEYKS